MPVTISGTSGVESPGYTQDGDPIVESGSNSDGEWTRWADGTQHVGFTQVRSTAELITWTYPVSFSELPEIAGVGVTGNPRLVAISGRSETSAGIGVYTESGTLSVSNCSLQASGRWK